ncbi:hypothetical protein JCM8208_001146 [Rhodotorula glutinis]
MASEPSSNTQVRPVDHPIPPAALHQALTPTLQQLVESPQSPIQSSRLFSLPVELLDIIFWDLYATAPPRAPICRALLAYHDEHHRSRFRRIKVVGSVMLASYCRSLQIRSSIGDMCEYFEAVAPRNGSMVDIAPAGLVLLIGSLSNVRYLELEGNQLVTAFLAQVASESSPSMPRVKYLKLVNACADSPDPYDPTLLRGLGTLSGLEVLNLELIVADGDQTAAVDDAQEADWSCAALRRLTLVDCKVGPGAIDLVKRCHHLVELDFRGSSPITSSLIASVGNFRTLTSLELSSSRPGRSWTLPYALKSLTSINFLFLGIGYTCDDQAAFDILRALPLKHLEFMRGSAVSGFHLLELISGDNKHESLKTVVLDQVYAEVGFVEEASWYGCFDEQELGDWLSEGFTLPEWTSTFSREHVVALVKAAAESGVDLWGGAVEALRNEEEIYDRQEEVKEWLEEDGHPSNAEALDMRRFWR